MLTGFLLGIGATVGVIAVCAFIETMSRNHEGRLYGQQRTAAGQKTPPVTTLERAAWLRKRAADAGYGQ